MKTYRKPAAFTALASALLLSGCIGVPAPREISPMRQTASVDGQWRMVQTTNAAGESVEVPDVTSSFRAGAFETRDSQTGEVLATGSYTESPDGLVNITVVSRVRQPQQVACRKVHTGGAAGFRQMNCTSSAGQNFVLMRQG